MQVLASASYEVLQSPVPTVAYKFAYSSAWRPNASHPLPYRLGTFVREAVPCSLEKRKVLRGFYNWRVRYQKVELQRATNAYTILKNWCNLLGLYSTYDSANLHGSLFQVSATFEGNPVILGLNRIEDVLSLKGTDRSKITRRQRSFLHREVVRIGNEVAAIKNKPLASVTVEVDALRVEISALLINLSSLLSIIESIRAARSERLEVVKVNRGEARSLGFQANLLMIVLTLLALVFAWLTLREARKPQLVTVRVELSTPRPPSLSTVRLIDAIITPETATK